MLEITGPQKEDEAKYKCVLKVTRPNADFARLESSLQNAEGSNCQSLNLVFD